MSAANNHPGRVTRISLAASGWALFAAIAIASPAGAATFWWNGTESDWNSVTAWSDNAGAATPNPLVLPGSEDDVVFNIASFNTGGTRTLGANQSVRSLTFSSSGSTTLAAGGTNRTLTIGAGGITRSGSGGVTLGSNTSGQRVTFSLAADQTWTGGFTTNSIISGSGKLTIDGSMTFDANHGSRTSTRNSYSGGTVINSGTVRLDHGAAFGTGPVTWNGGILALTTDNALQSGTSSNFVPISISADNLTLRLTDNAARTYNSNPWVLGAGISTFTLNVDRVRTGGSNFTLSLGAGLETAGPVALNVTGANGYQAQINGVSSIGGTLTVNATTAPLTVAGRIESAVSAAGLVKQGSNLVTLTANNTFTGPTTVKAGTLRLSGGGSIGSSSLITVEAGATLDVSARTGGFSVGGSQTLAGTGSVVGATSIAGTHAPGNSAGIQSFSADLSYESGAAVHWELFSNTSFGRGSLFDGIDVGGTLAFTGPTALELAFNGSGSSVDWNSPFWEADIAGNSGWLIWSGATSLDGFANLSVAPGSWLDEFGVPLASVRPDATFGLHQDGSQIYLVYTVPEPGGWLAWPLFAAAGWACRRRLRRWTVLATAGLVLGAGGSRAGEVRSADVAVYGGTPAGIAAAIAAARAGRSVLLVEPAGHVGGLTANGLSHTDIGSVAGVTGIFLEFTERVHAHYLAAHGPGSAQELACQRGFNGEPSVNRRVFEALLAEQPQIRLLVRHRLAAVEVAAGRAGGRTIRGATVTGPDGQVGDVQAAIFIDASYEGDLLAAAGVAHTIGREGRDQYGESLAPPRADGQVQAVSIRFTMTDDPELRVLPSAPAGYRREDFLPLLPLLGSERLERVFAERSGCIYKAHRPALPHRKYDINDVSRGLVRLSRPDLAREWPAADAAGRDRLRTELLRWSLGILHFLQTDPDVPEAFRTEARRWGLPRDEFVDTGHVPEQVYVREARRLIGQSVFTERHTVPPAGSRRGPFQPDSIATTTYELNCHGTEHVGPLIGGSHRGEFYRPVPPAQIPVGVILPRDCQNLLVPVACSASHVGFCGLRLEPTWTALGQAAGLAAHLAIAAERPVQEVPVARLQQLLHAAGAGTIYVADVRPTAAEFAAVQWWGQQGGLHDLPPAAEIRLPQVLGRPFAVADHAVGLAEPLAGPLRERWLEIARSLGLAAEPLAAATTRREFIFAARRLSDVRPEGPSGD